MNNGDNNDSGTKTDWNWIMFPFLLIHEVLYMLFEKNKELLEALATAPVLPGLESHRDNFCSRFGVLKDKLLSLGVFGDGVPHQKHKSVECLTWNIISLGMQSTRYLFTCIGQEITSETNSTKNKNKKSRSSHASVAAQADTPSMPCLQSRCGTSIS